MPDSDGLQMILGPGSLALYPNRSPGVHQTDASTIHHDDFLPRNPCRSRMYSSADPRLRSVLIAPNLLRPDHCCPLDSTSCFAHCGVYSLLHYFDERSFPLYMVSAEHPFTTAQPSFAS